MVCFYRSYSCTLCWHSNYTFIWPVICSALAWLFFLFHIWPRFHPTWVPSRALTAVLPHWQVLYWWILLRGSIPGLLWGWMGRPLPSSATALSVLREAFSTTKHLSCKAHILGLHQVGYFLTTQRHDVEVLSSFEWQKTLFYLVLYLSKYIQTLSLQWV